MSKRLTFCVDGIAPVFYWSSLFTLAV